MMSIGHYKVREQSLDGESQQRTVSYDIVVIDRETNAQIVETYPCRTCSVKTLVFLAKVIKQIHPSTNFHITILRGE
jgi:hypothetical protein